MYSVIDCAIWAVLGLSIGGIVGWCLGIVTAYEEDLRELDWYPEDEGDDENDYIGRKD